MGVVTVQAGTGLGTVANPASLVAPDTIASGRLCRVQLPVDTTRP